MERFEGFFSSDGKGFVFFSTASNLVILNLLWLLCCLPVVTAGASTAALYAVVIQMVKGEDSYIARSFFSSLKQNFRQAAVLWAVLACGAALVILDLSFSIQEPVQGAAVLFIPSAMCAVLLVLTAVYVFPIQAVFQNSVKKTLKNALLMSLAHLPQSVLAAVLALGPAAVVFIFSGRMWTALFFDCVIGFAFFAWVQAHIFVRLFERYMTDDKEDAGNEGVERRNV